MVRISHFTQPISIVRPLIGNLVTLAGVIVFGSDQEVAELMKAVKRKNATGRFNWIGSDGWSARALVSKGREGNTNQYPVHVL